MNCLVETDTSSLNVIRLMRWLAFLFMGTTILLPTSHVYIKPIVYFILAVAAGADIVWGFALTPEMRQRNLIRELTFDVVWITLIQMPTGQIHSPFSFLFALPILESALLLDKRGVTAIGVISAVILIPILMLHLWDQPLDLNHFFSYFVRFGLIFICTYLGGLLAERRTDT